MGMYIHHAIVITTRKKQRAYEARRYARQLGMNVSSVVETSLNGFWSFLIAPDGSKEGHPSSDKGDKSRDALINWIKEEINLNDFIAEWVEVTYGWDCSKFRITRTSGSERE